MRIVLDAGRDPVSGKAHLTVEADRRARITLTDYIESRYLPKLAIRRPTAEDYERTLRKWVLPYLGPKALAEISAYDVESWRLTIKYDGATEHVQAHAWRIFRAAVNKAVSWRLIDSSPFFGLRTPHQPERHLDTLTLDEANDYLDAFEGHRYELAVVLALAAGLRLSEICGLRWQDVDFVRGCVRITRSIREVQGGTVLQAPKSARSRREVSLPDWAMSKLTEYRKDSGPIFLVQPTAITQSVRAHVRECGLRQVPFRDLRHTHATLMLEAGTDVVTVSRRLGHSNVQVTDSFYLAPGRSADRTAARMAETLRR